MSASSFGSEQSKGVVRLTREGDGIVAICLEGEFDLTNARRLDDKVDRALDSGRDLILDLSEATFIDSSVIHVLVRAGKAGDLRKQAVVLQLGTAAIVERVLEIAAIEKVLTRAHDRQEAVRIIQTQARV